MTNRLVIALGLGAGLLLAAGQVDAQYRYTDDKGVSKVTQYKLDVPAPYRDAAVWIGATGVGKPALSEEQRKAKQRDDAYRRIGVTNEQLLPYKKAQAAEAAAQQAKKAQERRDAAEAVSARKEAREEEVLRLQRESPDLEPQRLRR